MVRLRHMHKAYLLTCSSHRDNADKGGKGSSVRCDLGLSDLSQNSSTLHIYLHALLRYVSMYEMALP